MVQLWLQVMVSLCCVFGTQSKYAFVILSNNSLQIFTREYASDIPEVHVARATYTNKINETGWAFLEVVTNADSSDEQQAFAAGYIEGYLTHELIWMHWQNMLKNYCANKTDACARIENYLNKNEQYIEEMINKYPNDSYWYQVKLYYIQLEGLAVGYNDATIDTVQRLSMRDILWINMLGDLDDLASALNPDKEATAGMNFLFGVDHCSGLVKLLPDHRDLYTSHVTWNSYQSMLRIQKKYMMQIHTSPGSEQLVPGHRMSFSSYPALVQSMDDFYILASGLVLGETTLMNSNKTLYANVKPRGQLLEFVRAMVANRLATTGEEWTRIFRKHNSGTYNNQWYIVDYKQFRPQRENRPAVIKPGLLWFVEQLPGYTEAADLTEQLVRDTFFPSFNMAYFPRMFNLSGGPERIDMYGDWFSYQLNPRAQMMRQRQSSVVSLKSMYRLMRYNDYKHDPLARCDSCEPKYSACNAVAARNDLNPANGTYPFHALGHRPHGATDAKITSYDLRKSYNFIAVSSLTHNVSRGIPPFKWSETDFDDVVRVGHPDLWMFQPIVHHWEWD